MFSDLARNQKVLTEIVLGQKGVQGPLGPNSVLIWTMILAALAPCLGQLASWLKIKSVERAVNGDRVKKDEEIKQLNLKVIEYEKSKAVLEAQERMLGEFRDKADIQVRAKEEGKAEAQIQAFKAGQEK